VLAIEYVSGGCHAEIQNSVYFHLKHAKYKYRILLTRVKATRTLPQSFIPLEVFLGKRCAQSQTLEFDATKFGFLSTFTERVENAKEDWARDTAGSPRAVQEVIMTSATSAVLYPNNTCTLVSVTKMLY
jgi:hypothetical protein